MIKFLDPLLGHSEIGRSSGDGSPGVTPGLYPIGGYVPYNEFVVVVFVV